MAGIKPTIKGIFVNSHIRAVEKQLGNKGVQELTARYGKPMKFRNSESVPVAEEIKIIEYALDILSKEPIPARERSFEAGRLHFRNFSSTPLARIVFSIFRKDFRLMMQKAQHIAGHVFQGIKFSTEDVGTNKIKVIMENNDYPLEHFRGLFYEWLHFAGSIGTVEGKQITSDTFEYTITWQ
jgi:uncharacterized protein (TIGR02265 family)